MSDARPLLGGRYSLERPLLSSPGEQSWMAIDATTGRLVVVRIADSGRLSTLEPARGLKHRQVATLLDIVREVEGAFPASMSLPVGAGAAVAEHVPGRTLRAVLEDGPLHPAKAVAWTLRLADAVQMLHSAGAVHGAISPRSVIAEPDGRAIAPVLSQLIAPPVGAFVPPERLRGSAETASDDVWALTATLYTALTGKPPFAAATRELLLKAMLGKPPPLASAGVNDPVLQEIIARGLIGERRRRVLDVAELQAALDGWEREPTRMPAPRIPSRAAARSPGEGAVAAMRDDDIVIDDRSLPDDQGGRLDPVSLEPDPETEPPSVPVGPPAAPPLGIEQRALPDLTAVAPAKPAAPRPLSRRVSFNPFERKRPTWPWVVIAALGGGAGVYVALAPGAAPRATTPEPASTEVAKPRAPARAVPKRDAEVVRNECVAEHFSPESFEGTPDFAFVCEDGDFPEIARRLHGMVAVRAAETVAVDAGAAAPAAARASSAAVTPASAGRAPSAVVTSAFGWYELPATAIIRKACCPQAAPVILPETQGWCEQLQSIARRMADDSHRSVDLGPGARAFEKAVGCLYANRVRHGYQYPGPPGPPHRAVFEQFLSRAAIVSARR